MKPERNTERKYSVRVMLSSGAKKGDLQEGLSWFLSWGFL